MTLLISFGREAVEVIMGKIFDDNFLKKIQHFSLGFKVILTQGKSGNRKSRSKGSSVEFSDYREYVEGDDFRRIDWNAFGRFEKLFVKLFMEEREAPITIFLDSSKSMDWGEPNKSIAARRLTAGLSYISLSNYDIVSIACINDRLGELKSNIRGKKAFGNVLSFLENIKFNNTTDLYSAVTKNDFKMKKGISIIISDLFDQRNIEETIKYLQFKKQEIIICHILSPQEQTPQFESDVRLIDSETGDVKEITVTQQVMKTYKKVVETFIARTEDVCFKRGVRYAKIISSDSIEKMMEMVVGIR